MVLKRSESETEHKTNTHVCSTLLGKSVMYDGISLPVRNRDCSALKVLQLCSNNL